MNNIYLIGMMGSGKSVTARRLAKILNLKFADLDKEIEAKEKMSIADLFKKKGEDYFREVESEVLREFSSGEAQAVATGGGIILDPANVELMRHTGRIVYLETSLEQLARRLEGKEDRPLLSKGKPQERLMEIYHDRKSLYENSADITVNSDGQTPEAVADKIREAVEEA